MSEYYTFHLAASEDNYGVSCVEWGTYYWCNIYQDNDGYNEMVTYFTLRQTV